MGRDEVNRLVRIAPAIVCLLVATALIASAFEASNTLYALMDDGDVESYGQFGTFGVSLLMLMAFGGTLLCCYGIYRIPKRIA